MTDVQFEEYLVLSRAWRSLSDKRNFYYQEYNRHSHIGESDEAQECFDIYVGYGKACNDLFDYMNDVDKPKQLEMDVDV